MTRILARACSVAVGCVVASSTLAFAQVGDAIHRGSLVPDVSVNASLSGGERHAWVLALQAEEFVQFRFQSTDPADVSVRDPNGEIIEPLGGWVDGLSRWAVIRIQVAGLWSVTIASERAREVEYELELAMRSPWPRAGNDDELPLSLIELGDEAVRSGDWQRAEARFAAGLATSRALFGDGNEDRWRFVLDRTRRALGDFYRGASVATASVARRSWLMGRRTTAVEELDDAIVFGERWLSTTLRDERTQASISGEIGTLIHTMVGFQLALGDVKNAYLYAERGRGQAQLRQVRAADYYIRDDTLEAQRDSLVTGRLRILEQRDSLRALGGDVSGLAALRDSIRSLDGKFSALYSRLRSTSVLEARLARSRVPIDSLQRTAVPVDGALLFYQLGVDRDYLFLVPPPGDTLEAYVLPADFETSLLTEVAAFPRTSDFGETSEALHEAWRALVPVAVWERIRALTEVVVVPDGALLYLPFEALVTEPGLSPVDTRFWLDDGPAIRYAISANALIALGDRAGDVRPMNGEVSLLTVAAPDHIGALSDLTRLPLLPGAQQEAARATSAFEAAGAQVTVLVGGAATEAAVRANLPSASYVHFASHGLASDDWQGLFSSLVLSSTDQDGEGPFSDGLLQLHEVYGMDLDGLELAVLSARSTGVGDSWTAGILALSGGFLIAGASRVIAPQWAPDDASTAVLIGDLFSQLAEGLAQNERWPSLMLRDAKRGTRADPVYSHPYFWAPFIATGVR